ncbi:cupin domain-containing protein [Flagellimonas algicola]|uniref:Cupin domain-containing protein n=1 Tax=Flagellimonas algicola TaxID=2583815 RepID=A0ABY2WGU6_9FLAO|nr:cupin domain-containing protein [Allomuricauda algicola]TMU50794.1 cupin domain-containing protein [Allomuricauda algicola]
MRKLVLVTSLFLLILGSCKSIQKEIQFTTLVQTSQSWNGNPLPSYSNLEPEVTIVKVIIPGKSKLAWHKHPNINAGVLLKGKLTVISENQDTLRLKAGDPIVELVDTWHYGINEKNKAVEIIVFYAGTKGVPLSVKKD